MKKIFLAIISAIILLGAGAVMAGTPDGASGPWADEMVSFNQGQRVNGTDVLPERSDPNQALGPAEGTDTINFVSLGFDGELVLGFENCILNGDGNDIEIVETSYDSPSCGAYPETVRIYASQDNSSWEDLGTSCLDGACDLGSLPYAKYVKLVDESDPNDFNGTADGFDVDGVKALYSAETCPEEGNDNNIIVTGDAVASAEAITVVNTNISKSCCDGDGGDQINVGNTAIVKNIQIAVSNTGFNGIANSITFNGDSEANNNDGNEIWTGNAGSWAKSKTIANSNLSEGCCGGTEQINIDNTAIVKNFQIAISNTGLNGIANVLSRVQR